ncbi:caspase domain-containing protein [Crepidotus variabilis]|uniref:Caspase domain-containing protein n=1 Tax=Crepidotus variabilis TaxID=179855 RepID=A0A9P6EIC9_9AGAR|nr:caspase domain-containing protein [Crepidotus variabilis]
MVVGFSYLSAGIRALFLGCRRLVFPRQKAGLTGSGNHPGTEVDEQPPINANLKPLATPLFVLVIGINNYNGLTQLEGATADALAVQRYLEDDLGVPSDQIVALLDGQATRTAILDAFKALANNPKIHQGDAILIFFAGHGTIVPIQAENSALGQRIQSVLPQDFDGQTIHPIPDYTLGDLIAAIHGEKGDNITVILDCCYSGSGTRQAADPYLTRSVVLEDSYRLPQGLDADLPRSQTRGITQVDTPGELTTHTLLAACSSSEQAREYEGRGQFTTALLQLLDSVDLSQLTYADIIDQIQVSHQNPQCEGVNRDRLVFGNKITSPKHSYRVELREGAPVLLAGAIDSISAGALVEIYSNKAAIGRLSPIGNAVVKSVEPFESVLEMSKPLPTSFSSGRPLAAIQTRPGSTQEPALYLAPGDELEVVRDALRSLRSENAGINFVLVDDRSKASLELTSSVEDGATMLTLHVIDNLVTKHGFTSPAKKIPADPENITRLLQAAAHFFYQLHSSFLNPVIQEKVKIEFQELRGKSKRTVVAGNDLLEDGKLFLDFVKGKRVLHGARITNNTNRALYVHAFYFDCSQISIAHYYGMPPPMQFSLDPQLPAGSPLTFGYGAGGSNALSFFVPEGQDNDLGFFKFVFSTRPVDLGNTAISSPFEPPSSSTTRGVRRTSEVLRKQTIRSSLPDAFGSILIPIIVQRAQPLS